MNTKIDLIVGARPNFMKAAPLLEALDAIPGFETRLVHTGQHYDVKMSDVFIADLGMRAPDCHLGVGAGSPGTQMAKIIQTYEELCLQDRPDWTVVVGDVTSTLAAALAAHKASVKVAHLEAGLRSYDRTMPEELNRVLTDQIADLLWTPSADADDNLHKENISGHVEMVGNIMIDTLRRLRGKALAASAFANLGLEEKEFGLITLHRPGNVDNPESMGRILGALKTMAGDCPLVFPVHPRTRKAIAEAGLGAMVESIRGLILTDPLGYLDFTGLLHRAKFVLTDSGGIQEETTWLHIPCMTLRPNTERPITTTLGTNRLVTMDSLPGSFAKIMNGDWPQGQVPPLWDGNTAARAAQSLARQCGLNDQKSRATA